MACSTEVVSDKCFSKKRKIGHQVKKKKEKKGKEKNFEVHFVNGKYQSLCELVMSNMHF